jgi:hypothetical protein
LKDVSKRDRTARERARQIVAAQKRAQERRKRLLMAAGAVGLVLVVFVVLIVVKVSGGGPSKTAAPAVSDSASVAAVVQRVTTVPPDVLDKIGAGKVDQLPKVITGQPRLAVNGKPLVLYFGAEYCPFCAAQRWPMVIALSRFGTFTGLKVTHSAADDSYPNTPTLSFHGATYTSDYLVFQGVETTTNLRQGNGYEPLDQPTADQQALVAKYDAPPYVDSESAGTIPFVDFANKAVQSGSSYGPPTLAGMTPQQVADALSDPTDSVAQAIDGTANAITALLCQITGNQPGNVCSGAAVKAYAGKFNGVSPN